MIRTILFDLDGTLLPMEQQPFAETYLIELNRKFVPLGYDREILSDSVMEGLKSMSRNDGSRLNEDVFWAKFAEFNGSRVYDDIPLFDEFYRNDFNKVRRVAQPTQISAHLVRTLKERDYQVILATNPFFPRSAINTRLSWVGLGLNDFDYVTTFENSHFCKPNLKYYEEILDVAGAQADQCIMIGNNPGEDMCAEQLGMDVYLVTDHEENPRHIDVSSYKRGSLKDAEEYLLNRLK